MNNFIKLCVGPMSRLVVDAVLNLPDEQRRQLCFIPSRRQVDFQGGYVNNWTTRQFSDYVGGKVYIQRDHGGPGQGTSHDDGYDSFQNDVESFQIIHIDPWKTCTNLNDGIDKTINTINALHEKNPEIKFEIGTEESIRRFSVKEFESLLKSVTDALNLEKRQSILYAVVQSGVGLDLLNMKNTGTFSAERLSDMVGLCNEYGFKSKEHNGDYLSAAEIQKRFVLGLDTINIAPEFGQIQTKLYIEHMNKQELDKFYDLCYESGKWKKWIDESDISCVQDLITVCGHYVFSHTEFSQIRPEIDGLVKVKITERIQDILEVCQ